MNENESKKLFHNHLAEGEVTGHYHAAEGVDYLDEMPDGSLKFDASKNDVTITHQEHHSIKMPKKKMVSGRVREQDHFEEAARAVID